MQTSRFKLYKLLLINLGIYLVFFIITIFVSSKIGKTDIKPFYLRKNYVIITVLGIAFHTFYLYYSMNRLYVLLVLRKRFLHFAGTLSIMALSYTAYLTLSDLLSNGFEEAMKQKLTPRVIILSYVISFVLFSAVTFFITYIVYLLDEKKQRAILEKQKTELEIEKAHANLNFLKAQINPHFLHNTLNYLYAKSIPYSAELSEGILTLSEIMRYALTDNLPKDGKALLKDEIEHVRNVIRINQLRFSNNLKVDLEVKGVINGARIIPFVLITIVENAFKHGDIKSNEHPVRFALELNNGSLHFYARNKKKTGPKEISTGIGLDNIKKRLELAYNNNYVLDIQDEQDFYTTRLSIYQL
ncbi:histidine kinase [Terrimonas sp. NA20]|uniref:Histidine kinase n=1 Tax=Terrimonas ginsenosidimutans TaxID=2908004 RepID=A0ABS9KT29_9BACT|nr:histidine kinase [Terrimonas ginsenosidimutans]MCG2615496.1 histidine kinase [Terrimonas ginsenosidimutans]